MIKLKDIYNLINSLAPYCTQESYDNSGINVGDENKEIRKILLALDVTKAVAEEAVSKKCDLVISHHPVIFKGLKTLSPNNPAVILASGNVAAVSMHTNFDSAQNGMNDILAQKLDLVVLEGLHNENGVNCGYVCELKNRKSAKELACHCKNALGCKVVRYSSLDKGIKKIALCSGAGGEFLSDAVNKGCDALITGDVKHNVFVDAANENIQVFDAGHYYTENIFFDWLKEKLNGAFNGLEISVAENNSDLVSVV